MALLFVYGTLKRNRSNNRLLQNSRFLGSAVTVKTYPMLSAWGIPAIYDTRDKQAKRIEGDLYDVPNSILENYIDRLEGHPTWYCRKHIGVRVNEKSFNAWCYFLPEKEYQRCKERILSYGGKIELISSY